MKKKILIYGLVGTSILSTILMYGEIKKYRGIINNQKTTIDGLTIELKKVSYHLGKLSKRRV
jgi:hypothetical protein